MILIIAKSGALRDGLQALAQALPGFEKVVRADSARTAYEGVEENPIKLATLYIKNIKDRIPL